MQASEYQQQFGRTLAPVFFLNNVNPAFVGQLMDARKKSADIIDAVKRALIYGNTERLKKTDYAEIAKNPLGLPFFMDEDELHAILGMEGEVGEISEAVLSDDPRDVIRARVVDESGDFLWYLSLLFKKFDITFEEVFERNIAKLAKRYPDKFTTELAVNRDLEAEAEVFRSPTGAVEIDLTNGKVTFH
jgi:NTP pyrophosphatase (non-canonical NTP hydrolase)